MLASITEYDTVYHLMSRIAHKVYILNEDDRSDLLDIIHRAADFTGIQILGWCIMTNHFHILVYLPFPSELNEQEVLRRYGVLKGKSAQDSKAKELAQLRSTNNDAEADRWLQSQRKRMYDIGSFMKIVKQWFTEAYNERYSHTGTLWEGRYKRRLIDKRHENMSRCLAYIHLNPIRAAMATSYDEYPWSSFHALTKNNRTAIAGIQFVYEPICKGVQSEQEIASIKKSHIDLMDKLLEDEKRRRAEEIARRRAAGQEAPCDPLTTEALVIQQAAHLEEVRKASASIMEETQDSFSGIEKALLTALYLNPMLSAREAMKKLGVSIAAVYRIFALLKAKGAIDRKNKKSPWILNVII